MRSTLEPSWANSRVTLFDTCRSDEPSAHPTVAEVLEMIRQPSAAVADVVHRIRTSAIKTVRDAGKRTLPAVVFAADLSTRDRDIPLAGKVLSRSGLCCLDFDHLGEAVAEHKEAIAADAYTAAVFLSPGGAGLKVLVCFADPERFLECWRAAVDHYQNRHGLVADPARKDVAGLCYLSVDPEMVAAAGEVLTFAPLNPPADSAREWASRPLATVPANAIPNGQRNATLASLAGTMRNRGMSADAIQAALKAENLTRCSPPLDDGEVAGIANSVARYAPAEPATPAPWPVITPLHAGPVLMDLDLTQAIPKGLPQLAAFMRQTSTALQVPVEMVAPLVLSVASLGTARALEVECWPGWVEPAPVWVAVLADPGERKSALLASIAHPVYRWQREERERLADDLACYAEKRRQVEARLAGLRAAMSKPPSITTRRSQHATADLTSMERDAGDLAKSLGSMPDLRAPELVTADTTPEAARDLLARNGEKLAIIAAEGDQLDVLLGRYGDGKANLGLFLGMHAGDYCPAHRVGRDVALERPAGVLCLCVQPQAVDAILASPEAVGRGLVARFLFVRPCTWMGRRELEPPPVDRCTAAWWEAAMQRLLALPWPGRVVVGPDGPMRCALSVRVLRLTSEARAILLDLRTALEPRLSPDGGDLHRLAAFASKLPGAVARIALAFQALEDAQAEVVGADCMRAACAWAPFLLAHAESVMGEAGDPAVASARKVWRWIDVGLRQTFTAGECYRDNRSTRLASPEALMPALDLLEAHGLVRRLPSAPSPKGGRPSLRYEVNPAAYATVT